MNFLQHKVTAAERAANGVVSAPDTLSGTPRENKSIFDKLVGFFVDKYNLMLDTLQTVSDGLDTHIASRANPHAVTKAQVGLGSVDNTADADKPIPAAQAQVNATTAQQLTTVQAAADSATSSAAQALNTATGIAATAQDALFTAKDARTLAESVAIVYDPTTGTQVTVSVALQSIYELVKSAPMTAQDFANNKITVDFFRSKKMTAAEYATRGKQILLGG